MAKAKKPSTRKTTEPTDKTTEEMVEQVLEQPTEETTEPQGPQPIGQLFNVINYNNMDDLNTFITSMTPDQGLYILVQAARAAHTRGIFSIEEAETVSKAIRTITSSSETPQESVDTGESDETKA